MKRPNKLFKIIKALLLAPFLCLIGGTLNGRASFYTFAQSKQVGPWLLLELSAADREKLRELAVEISGIEDDVDCARRWAYMKMLVIASCAVNKRGWYLYDPLNKHHLNTVADMPDRLIEQALEAIDALSAMPWLRPPRPDSTQTDETDGANTNP